MAEQLTAEQLNPTQQEKEQQTVESNPTFKIIEPKAAVAPMTGDSQWTVDSIDYDTHPAYAEMIAKENNPVRSKAMKVFIKSFLSVLVKRLINYEFIPLEYRKPETFSQRIGFYSRALKNALIPNFGAANRPLNVGVANDTYHCVIKNGIVAVKLSDEQTNTLVSASQPSFDYLIERREQSKKNGARVFEDSRSYKRRSEHEALFATIEKILADTGVIDAAAKYMGRHVGLVDVNPQINDSSDDFWRKAFPDLADIEHPDTAYFHRDASGGDLKVIFYLSDVSENNGPFNFAVGSHDMKLSRLDDYICEANDSNGFAGTSLSARQQFSALPRSLRQKGTFGNDLRQVDKLRQQVIDATWQVCAPQGSLVMFDTKGIHRGGLVTEGERRVVTCIIG